MYQIGFGLSYCILADIDSVVAVDNACALFLTCVGLLSFIGDIDSILAIDNVCCVFDKCWSTLIVS